MDTEPSNETIESWSAAIASLAVDALVDCGLVKKEDVDRAEKIVAEEIWVRLLIEDYPPPAPPNS